MLMERQIELRAQLMMDALDRKLMRGDMQQAEYDLAVQELDQWVEAEHTKGR